MSEEIVLAPDDQPLEGDLATPLETARDFARRTAFRHRFNAIYAALAVVALVSFFTVYRWTTAPIRVVHTYSDRNVVDAKFVAASLHPRSVVDGANLGLPSGTVCYFGKNATGVFVVCPG